MRSMTIGTDGLSLLTEFEGKHAKLPDGRYAAYLCPAGKPTIFIGCTHGVEMGMVVTEAEGRAMLSRELSGDCAQVSRMLKVEVTQAQFDALVCLAYNIGWPTLEKSTLMKKLNAGDVPGAAARFNDFRKARVDGKLVTLPGLVRRRAAETALFMSDDKSLMAQAVEATPVQWTLGDTMKAATGLALVGQGVIEGGKAAVDVAKPVADAAQPIGEAAKAMKQLKETASDLSIFEGVVKSISGSLNFLVENWEMSVVMLIAGLAIAAISSLRSSAS